MRSRASIKGHPIHTALIPFPFAFITGGFAFHVFGWLSDRASFSTTGEHLLVAGVATAVVAAVPGAIDYRFTVPPRSSGKRRATRHMLTNLGAVGIVVAALIARRWNLADLPLLAFEAVATGLLCYGGLLGGVLVTRNQISIDHRYADAGKWNEASFAAAAVPLVVARADELAVNQMKLLRIGERRIVLARGDHGYVAFDDRCTHRGGSLAGGTMTCGIVMCPWHGSQFDTQAGTVKAGPAEKPIRSYHVEQRDADVVLLSL